MTVCNGLTQASATGTRTLASVSALTDTRDSQTYAIAKLADGNCWMIENLRLADIHQENGTIVPTVLTIVNTNNPLNDGTNVTLKHNYADTQTHDTLSATSSDATSWCNGSTATCIDKSRLRTINTTSRAVFTSSETMFSNVDLYAYGNYYNWYSATAGRGVYDFSTNNDSTVGDLCPVGWRLPVGGQTTVNTTGDYYTLIKTFMDGMEPNQADVAGYGYSYYYGIVNGVNAGKKASNTIRSYPSNFVYSGYVSGASQNNRSLYGGYWSSTTNSSDLAFLMSINDAGVSAGTARTSKYEGRVVRCSGPSR